MIGKRCSRCGVRKDRASFNQRKESRDGLAFWCRACDKRNAANRTEAVEGKQFGALPKRDLECGTCHQVLAFGTDWDGRLIERCGCGRRYVTLKPAPQVERKHSSPRCLRSM